MRPRAKLTIHSLQEVVYKKSIGTKINDLYFCVEVVLRSCQPLRHICHWIHRKPLEIDAWFQRTTNGKWTMGYQMVTLPMTSRDLERCCEAIRSAVLAAAWLLVLLMCQEWLTQLNKKTHPIMDIEAAKYSKLRSVVNWYHQSTLLRRPARLVQKDNKKAVLSQRWPRDARYISRSWAVAAIRNNQDGGGRHLEFIRIENSAIRSAVPKNPTL